MSVKSTPRQKLLPRTIKLFFFSTSLQMELVAIETVEGLEMQKKISEKLVCIIDVYKECKPSSSSSSSVLLVFPGR